ncbi:MAG: universal stress protein [Bacteroidia bacterium]|jgi:nucleotide-binding universal stress UspA family protein
MENKKKNTILVPFDFSEIATHALNHAIQIAKHFDNNIALLHVVEEAFLSSLLGFGKSDEKEAAAREKVQERLNSMKADIEAKNKIQVTVSIRFGKIYKEIAAAATELGCDSIVMGSNGASGMEQIIGSNASRTIIHSSVPVIVVKSDRATHAYSNIVFPLDLTIESRQKVSWAIHIGKSYSSTIRVLTYKVGDEDLNTGMRAALRQVTRLLEENGVKYTEHILNHLGEEFAIETIKYAEAIDADLIMIMSQKEGMGLSDYIIGTEAQQLVNKSENIPIMCIKPSRTGFSSDFVV